MKQLSIYHLIIFFIVGMSSCKDEATQIRELLEERKTDVVTKLVHVERIAALERELIKTREVPKSLHTIQHFKLIKKKLLPSANAAVVNHRDLFDITSPSQNFATPRNKQEKVKRKLMKTYQVAPRENVINIAASLHNFQKFPISQTAPDLDDYHDAFKKLHQLKYLVIIYDESQVEPTLEGNSFTQGSYKGFVTVYDVDSELCLGGFELNAQSSTEIKSYNINNQSLGYYHLMRDYLTNIQQAFKDALKKNIVSQR